jgi:CHAT domain-containing protein
MGIRMFSFAVAAVLAGALAAAPFRAANAATDQAPPAKTAPAKSGGLIPRVHVPLPGLPALGGVGALGGFDSAPRGDFALGRSATSGAVCRAVRDFDDPAGVGEGRRAWQVKCSGWTQTLGRLYYLKSDRAVGANSTWRKGLAGRADCDFAHAMPQKQMRSTIAVNCKSKPVGVDYIAYAKTAGNDSAAAEGLAPLGDVLATGIKVVTGRMKPPTSTAEQAGGAGATDTAASASLAAAANSEADSEQNRKEAAYRDTQAWRFGAAETQFSGLANAEKLAPAVRAEAALNLALNVSNEGRFAEAESYFKVADGLVDQANTASLKALGLNYRAMHARNQRRFEDAIALANQAMGLRQATAGPTDTKIAANDRGDLLIPRGAAAAINSNVASISSSLSGDAREALRDAQALQVIGTSYGGLKQKTEAKAALAKAEAILTRPYESSTLGRSSPWLLARVEADLAGMDRDEGNSVEAVKRLSAGLEAYQAKYGDTLAAGGFLIELARAKAAAGDEEGALADYEHAFSVFKVNRGSLGASADQVGAYFDILLARIGKDYAGQSRDVTRFFDSSETLVSESAAAATLQFAERLSSEGSAAAGITRALDAAQREKQQLDVQRRQLEQASAYTGEAKDKLEVQLAAADKQIAELQQVLFAKNPKYATALDPTIKLPQLQGELRDGEAYLKVLLLANRGYGILITKTEVKPYGIELNRAQALAIGAKIRAPFDNLRQSNDLDSYDVPTARELYKRLFGPIDADLGKLTRLIYEPDPTLIGVPIGALVVDDESLAIMKANFATARKTRKELTYAGVHWLETRLETTVSISSAAFYHIRRSEQSKAAKPFLGFADPVIKQSDKAFASVTAPPSARLGSGGADFCLPYREALFTAHELPETRDEVKVVAQTLGVPDNVVLGADFTDDRVKAQGANDGGLDQYKVLYFATHGLLPAENGCLPPALITSVGPGDSDALLDVKEIPELHLEAELVVLSACDTGAGAGDGLAGGGASVGGLVSAFTYAGARNLLVSNWPVDSAATEQLMTTMFKVGGGSQGEALAKAQTALMNSSNGYSHPFYWAAFSLIGDGSRPMPKL